jgi:hypothetical protein
MKLVMEAAAPSHNPDHRDPVYKEKYDYGMKKR